MRRPPCVKSQIHWFTLETIRFLCLCAATASTGVILFSGYLSVPFSQTQYLRNASREFFQFLLKWPVELKDEWLNFSGSKFKVTDLTLHIFGYNSRNRSLIMRKSHNILYLKGQLHCDIIMSKTLFWLLFNITTQERRGRLWLCFTFDWMLNWWH